MMEGGDADRAVGGGDTDLGTADMAVIAETTSDLPHTDNLPDTEGLYNLIKVKVMSTMLHRRA